MIHRTSFGSFRRSRRRSRHVPLGRVRLARRRRLDRGGTGDKGGGLRGRGKHLRCVISRVEGCAASVLDRVRRLRRGPCTPLTNIDHVNALLVKIRPYCTTSDEHQLCRRRSR